MVTEHGRDVYLPASSHAGGPTRAYSWGPAPTSPPVVETPLGARTADALDGILAARTAGLEELASRVEGLIRERREAGRTAAGEISRDATYLENLILDRFRHGERATDDRTYVTLRLQQLRLQQEARQENVSCWRDTVLLAKELAELMRKTDDARRQEALMRSDAP